MGDTGGMLAAWFRMKYPNIIDGMPGCCPWASLIAAHCCLRTCLLPYAAPLNPVAFWHVF